MIGKVEMAMENTTKETVEWLGEIKDDVNQELVDLLNEHLKEERTKNKISNNE